MKTAIIEVILLYGLLISCYKPYTTDVEANERILVVESMITNEVASYHVNLSYARPFYSGGSALPENSARVYVIDDLGNYYQYKGLGNGSYCTDPSQFKGSPGRTYTLYIETPDGEIYRSGPQRLEPEFSQDSIYAEVDYQETISRYNQTIITIRGASISIDIGSLTDTLPRFRFTSNLVNHYFYNMQIPPGDRSPFYSFYCWQTDNINPDINLTHKKYSVSSSYIRRHEVYFIDDQIYVDGIVYGLGPLQPDLSHKALVTMDKKSYVITNRILYLNQYTLNNETYSYYQRMDEQLRSEGTLFDPIAVQLIGNITCTSNNDKKVFGFFEASSVNHTAYLIGFRNYLNQYTIIKQPYILPSIPNGCWINKVPPFWIK
jgi:hypothetical protein